MLLRVQVPLQRAQRRLQIEVSVPGLPVVAPHVTQSALALWIGVEVALTHLKHKITINTVAIRALPQYSHTETELVQS